MGRLIILIGVCLIIIGTLITLNIPLNWVGHLPGDFSLKWGETRVFIPLTTAIIASFVLSVLLFAFSKR
ncbi:MAG: DUF2905 domain-containing protein [Simkaniaceae bacterium]|nr:MAG: DUF2905 domain-containing protein [Simkaniaceae bacterium]